MVPGGGTRRTPRLWRQETRRSPRCLGLPRCQSALERRDGDESMRHLPGGAALVGGQGKCGVCCNLKLCKDPCVEKRMQSPLSYPEKTGMILHTIYHSQKKGGHVVHGILHLGDARAQFLTPPPPRALRSLRFARFLSTGGRAGTFSVSFPAGGNGK